MVTVKTSETRFREIDGVTQKLDLVELWGLTSDVPNLPTEGIENMSLFIEAKEDGAHANDSVRLTDTRLSVSAGDDAVTVSNRRGDGFFYMESGDLNVPSCVEGVEAAKITIAGESAGGAITEAKKGVSDAMSAFDDATSIVNDSLSHEDIDIDSLIKAKQQQDREL